MASLPAENPPRPAAGGRHRARRSPLGPTVALVLLALFAGAQVAGVLLRDRIEGRQEVSPVPPPAAATAELPPASPHLGARFGPEVREVRVAAAPSPDGPAQPEAPVETSEPSAEPPEPPAEPPETALVPPPFPPPESLPEPDIATEEPPPDTTEPPDAGPEEPSRAVAETAPAPRPGSHVLQVGVFRSQEYRRQAEDRLDGLGIPHYRVEGARQGVFFRVTVLSEDAATRARAAQTLDRAGFLYRVSGAGVEARFFLEREAGLARELLAEAGLPVQVSRVEGEMPLWTVFAGPYSEAEARETRALLLGRHGIETYLRRRP
ncbi:MAG: hypothetical protein SCH98_01160 [Deferrisomatales bacterium]|nr:hypothetical protein [Deferrisomatales bacterium]